MGCARQLTHTHTRRVSPDNRACCHGDQELKVDQEGDYCSHAGSNRKHMWPAVDGYIFKRYSFFFSPLNCELTWSGCQYQRKGANEELKTHPEPVPGYLGRTQSEITASGVPSHIQTARQVALADGEITRKPPWQDKYNKADALLSNSWRANEFWRLKQ